MRVDFVIDGRTSETDVIVVFEVCIGIAQRRLKLLQSDKELAQIGLDSKNVANVAIVLFKLLTQAIEVSWQRVDEYILNDDADELAKSKYDAIMKLVTIAVASRLTKERIDQGKEAMY